MNFGSMTTEQERNFEELENFIAGYRKIVINGFDDRWSKVRQDIYNNHISETIGALMSRQATLSIEMVSAPTTWNRHVAPLFLRCMIDAYITLAWILSKPQERSKKYIEYGLGQEKLLVEYLEEVLNEAPDSFGSKSIKDMIEVKKGWLDTQLADGAIEVNVGSWSGVSVREMAKEIGQESIYKHAYVPFSGAAHNMWQYVGIHNVESCSNPLHKWHVVPKIRRAPVDIDFMYQSAKCISITFKCFDEKMGIKCNIPLPEQFLVEHELFSGEYEDDG